VTDREQYTPGPASGAQVRKDGEKRTLILVRELRHSPEKVWQAGNLNAYRTPLTFFSFLAIRHSPLVTFLSAVR